MRAFPILILAAATLGLASCAAPTGTGPTAAAPAVATAAPRPSDLPVCTADDIGVAGDPGTKPTITVPSTCAPPTELLSKDLVVGTGREVTVGATMQTHYDLVTWSDGRELDSSWSRGKPFPLENVGRAAVIDGWNEGLVGMKEGGRRLLVVPPDKGYGSQGRSGIKPGETLVFVVDAVAVS